MSDGSRLRGGHPAMDREKAWGASVWGWILPVGVAVLAWQGLVWAGVSKFIVPSPLAVVEAIVTDVGAFAAFSGRTFYSAVVGLLIGTAVGVGIAVLTWLSPILRTFLASTLIIMYSVPIVATIPLMARMFGYNQGTVLAVAALVSMFPAYVLTSSGMRSTPPGADDVLAVLGAGKLHRLRHLALPSAVPNFLTAFRLNAAVALVAAVIGEYLTGVDGLGWMFNLAFFALEIPRAWAAGVLIIAYSVLAYAGAVWLEDRGRERVT